MNNRLKFTYLGGAALLLEDQSGAKALIDPFLSENPHTDLPLEDFFGVDLLLVSHAAFDHMGDTVALMQNSDARLIAGFEVCDICAEAGVERERMWVTVQGDSRSSHGYSVRTVPALHASLVRKQGVVSGIPFGYVITSAEGICVYHPGDTCIFSDMKMLGELYRPHIMLAGVDRISEPYPGEMTPREAALAADWVGAEVVIPAHYAPGSRAPHEFMELSASLCPHCQVAPEIGHAYTYYKSRLEGPGNRA